MTTPPPQATPAPSATDSRHFQLYDNEKDWGPNHLAGPPGAAAIPGRHIEDSRQVPPDDPSKRDEPPAAPAATAPLPTPP